MQQRICWELVFSIEKGCAKEWNSCEVPTTNLQMGWKQGSRHQQHCSHHAGQCSAGLQRGAEAALRGERHENTRVGVNKARIWPKLSKRREPRGDLQQPMEKKIILQLRFYYYYYSVPVKSINSFIKRRWRWPGGEFVLCHSVMDGWEVRATTKVLKLPCCSPCTACSRYSFISVHAHAYWHSSCFKCCHEREIWRWAPSFTNASSTGDSAPAKPSALTILSESQWSRNSQRFSL